MTEQGPIVVDFQSDERMTARGETVDAILATILSQIPEDAKGAKMATFDGSQTMNFFRPPLQEVGYFRMYGGFSEGRRGGYIFTEGDDLEKLIGTATDSEQGLRILKESEAKQLYARMKSLIPVAIIK